MAVKRGANERNRRRKEAKKRVEDALNAEYNVEKKRDILAHSIVTVTEVITNCLAIRGKY